MSEFVPPVRLARAGAPLLSLLLALGLSSADALVRLGDPLPAHPWPAAEREVVVIYTHDCGDLGPLWKAVLESGLPVRAVNVSGVAVTPPGDLPVWRGEEADQFARRLKVRTYPAVLLVRQGRVLNAWEGNFAGTGLNR